MTENEYYDQFALAFSWMQKEVHELAISKGWWDQLRSELELMCLIMSELGEATEAVREDSMSSKILGFSGLEEELSDVIIRVMDMAQQGGLRLAEAIIAKHQYNQSRPIRHGGKKY